VRSNPKVKRAIDYTLCEAETANELDEQVADYLMQDPPWVMHGSPVVVCYDGHFFYHQAMVLMLSEDEL